MTLSQSRRSRMSCRLFLSTGATWTIHLSLSQGACSAQYWSGLQALATTFRRRACWAPLQLERRIHRRRVCISKGNGKTVGGVANRQDQRVLVRLPNLFSRRQDADRGGRFAEGIQDGRGDCLRADSNLAIADAEALQANALEFDLERSL